MTLSHKLLAQRDPRLGRAIARLPACPAFPDAATARLSQYEYLARAIIYQQLSGKAAATIHRRVCALTLGSRFPSARDLHALPDARVREAGVSGQKLLALRDLAQRALDGELPVRGVARMDDAAIIERLVAIRGIGEWSAQMFLMFRLGRPDVMPSTDLGVQEGLRRLDGLVERPTPREVLARAELWRPHCSVASWYLWRLADAVSEAS